jgi:decaprenylphospho-beta-D-erythro-pentofuranosid-2-ulose 2-reductase
LTADAFGYPRSVLVLGGTSDIGLAIARRLAASGARQIVLAGRDVAALEAAGQTLGPVSVTVLPFDATQTSTHPEVLARAWGDGDVDLVVLAFGQLGDAADLETDADRAVDLARVNYVGAVSMGLRVATRFREQGHGTLVVLSSVAGERVRRANFVYGSTKAGLDGFSQGLGYALAGSGARVLIVRPGVVRSKMTAEMPDRPFTVEPEQVAEAVLRGLRMRAEIIWVPPVLRWVMAVVRHLPRGVFRRLPL